jgi:TRAP-type transport system periplasmic protein
MRLLTTTAIMAALASIAATADARELRGAPGAPPAHPAHSHIYQTLVDDLPAESDGAITMTILGPEVVNLGQVRDALTSGLIDVGNLLPLYYPAELPNMTLAGELALSSQNPHAMGAAITEYTVNCDSCQQEMVDLRRRLYRVGVIRPLCPADNEPGPYGRGSAGSAPALGRRALLSLG